MFSETLWAARLSPTFSKQMNLLESSVWVWIPSFVHSRPEVFLCDFDLCLSLPLSLCHSSGQTSRDLLSSRP